MEECFQVPLPLWRAGLQILCPAVSKVNTLQKEIECSFLL